MSTSGLTGILSWHQARSVAATAGRPLPAVSARLDEAVGSRLATSLVTLQDDPAVDSAQVDGFALCGEGPWFVRDEDDVTALRSSQAHRVTRGQAIPPHTDAVLSLELAEVQRLAGGELLVIALDPLSRVPDDRARPGIGDGIVRQAERGTAGEMVVEAGLPVTPALVSLAASLGHDHLSVVRTPVVGTLVLGGHLLDRGLPRQGRSRDALGAVVPAFAGQLGARGNPALRAPDTADLLLQEIDDANVDILVTTGSTALAPDNHLRAVLRDLDARWLVDGVAASPGAQMLLARLPDGRFIVGLPGDPVAALSAMVTLLPPLVRGLRDDAPEGPLATGILLSATDLPEYADDTLLAPVRLQHSRAGTTLEPLTRHGHRLAAWAQADAIAVVQPGAGQPGDVVEVLLPPPGLR